MAFYGEPPSSSPIESCTFDYPNAAGAPERAGVLAWRQNDEFTTCVSPQGPHSGSEHRQHRGRDVREVVEELYYSATNVQWGPPPLLPGEYHPRIWRNGICDGWLPFKKRKIACYPPYFSELRARCIALHRIQNMFASVFEVIPPRPEHDHVSGGALRQLLLLSAVEVEGLLKGAYLENLSTRSPGPLNINAYARLAQPMRLGEWAVAFSYFDEAGVTRPFAGWTHGHAPTWWTAYNALKHEPDQPLRYRDALDCCLAIRVLIEAHFGPYCEEMLPEAGLAEMKITAKPTWEPEELYYPPISYHILGSHRPKLLF